MRLNATTMITLPKINAFVAILLLNSSNKRVRKVLFKVDSLKKGLLLVIFLFSILTSCNASQERDLGTFDDPSIALIETKKVLSLLSKNVNKGYQSVHYINEYEVTRNKIFNLN
jgi:hypothetical protein